MSTQVTNPARRILVIYPAGQPFYIDRKWPQLLKHFEVTFLFDSLAPLPAGAEEVDHIQAPYERILSPTSGSVPILSSVKDLLSVCARVDPAIVITYELCSAATFQLRTLKRVRRVRHVVLAYETLTLNRSFWGLFPLTRLYARLSARGLDLAIAHTERAKQSLLSAGVSPHRIVVQYPCINVDGLSGEARESKQTSRDSDRIRVVFLGRLSTNKGIELALDALRDLNERKTCDIDVTIIGDGPLSGVVKMFVSQLPNARYLGRITERVKQGVLADQDILICPSITVRRLGIPVWEEQTSTAVLEAMSFGLAVVGSRCGSIPEILGRDDVLFREGSLQGLKQVLARLISDRVRLKEVKRYNAARAVALFSSQGCVDRIDSVLATLMSEGGTAPANRA